MPIDFSIQQQAMPSAPGMAAGFAAAQGSLFGNAVVEAESPMSLLADAAEELTFAADTTDDFELDERKERDKMEKALSERVKMYRQLMNEKGEAQQIDQLKDAIRAREGQENALRQARRHFPDPSDAWAALKSVQEALEEDPSVPRDVLKEALDDIQSALDVLDAEQGPAIRAGVQGALAARGFEGLDGLDGLRGLYRHAVCDFTDVNALYAHIQEHYGDDFDQALNFLYKAIANDLATDVPSMETKHLEHVNANLGELRSLQSAHSLCATLMARWAVVHGVTCGLDAMKLLGAVVALRQEHFLGASQVNAIAAQAGPPDIERKVLFLQELLNIARSFSPTLFDGPEGRMKVLDAVQDAVDAAIVEEDAFLASQE